MLIVWLVILLLSDPNILPDEVAWLDDPNILPTLFVEWREERSEPYVTVLVENYLRPDRHRSHPKTIDGILYETWTAPYAWAADLNHDGKINFIDFGIVAKYHTRSFLPPSPKLPPSKLETLSKLAELIFMGGQE